MVATTKRQQHYSKAYHIGKCVYQLTYRKTIEKIYKEMLLRRRASSHVVAGMLLVGHQCVVAAGAQASYRVPLKTIVFTMIRPTGRNS